LSNDTTTAVCSGSRVYGISRSLYYIWRCIGVCAALFDDLCTTMQQTLNDDSNLTIVIIFPKLITMRRIGLYYESIYISL